MLVEMKQPQQNTFLVYIPTAAVQQMQQTPDALLTPGNILNVGPENPPSCRPY